MLVQKTWRSKKLTQVQRKDFLELRRATLVIQSRVRLFIQFKARNKSATVIQSHFRGYLARKKYKAVISATRTLQKYTRSFLTGSRVRQHYLKRRIVCTTLQAAFRGWKVRKSQATQHEAATIICAHYRGYRARLCHRALCHSARVTQARFRANVLGREQKAAFLLLKRIALMIQSCFRGAQVRRQVALEQEVKQKAAITIQRVFRGHYQHCRYLSIQKVATVIQPRWRATLAMRADRRTFSPSKRVPM